MSSIEDNIYSIFTNEKFINYIKLNHEIKAIILGGSRMFNLDDENSDVDVDILVNDEYFKNLCSDVNVPILYAKCNDITIHWYYVSIDFKLNNEYDTYIRDIWMCELYFGLQNKNNIIKVYDEDYLNKYLEYIKNNYHQSIINVKKQYLGTIYYFINDQDYLKIINGIGKIIYFLCILGYLCNNISLNKELLLKIKRYAKRNQNRFSFEKITELNDDIINTIDQTKDILRKLLTYLENIDS